MRALRSIDAYLRQLAEALQGQNAAVIREALEASEEYLRSEVAAHPEQSEGDVLELISSTYGAPEDVAAIYPLQARLRDVRPAQMGGCRCFLCLQARTRRPRHTTRAGNWSGTRPLLR